MRLNVNQKVITLLTYSLVFITGLTFANLYIVFAQDTGKATGDEASIGNVYTAMLLSAFSLAGNVINWYLSEKAKRVGLNPNSTDEKFARAFLEFSQRFSNAEQKIAELTNFTFKALPQQAQEIIDKPTIRVAELTKDIKKADEQVAQAKVLVEAIEDTASPAPK